MDKSYIAENDAERTHLYALVARLSDADLAHPMPAGWTVAGVFAHMAFWDAWALQFINKWEATGTAPTAADHECGDVNCINDSAKPLCLALPPRRAAQLALELAEETDRRVAAMSDELVAQMIAVGPPFSLSRAIHRREHLDEIEFTLRH